MREEQSSSVVSGRRECSSDGGSLLFCSVSLRHGQSQTQTMTLGFIKSRFVSLVICVTERGRHPSCLVYNTVWPPLPDRDSTKTLCDRTRAISAKPSLVESIRPPLRHVNTQSCHVAQRLEEGEYHEGSRKLWWNNKFTRGEQSCPNRRIE